MTISFVIGMAIVIGVILLIVLSSRKESHRLDDLHITGTQKNEK